MALQTGGAFRDTTDRLELPLILPSQAQKHVIHNEALIILDALVQLSVVDNLDTPPSFPAEGDRYIVAGEASGVWEDRDNSIAIHDSGQWSVLQP